MKLFKSIATAVLIGSALSTNATAQQTAVNSCGPYPALYQSTMVPPCGCAGHGSACGCHDAMKQIPPNPLAPGRPSPPACAADGICYPNCQTWGHYATRWRQWPVQIASAGAAGARTSPALGPDARPYMPPSIEEEDRRAPPPTAPRAGDMPPMRQPVQGAPPAEGQAPPPATGSETGGPAGLPSPQDLFGPEESPGVTPLVPESSGPSPPTSPSTSPEEPMGDNDAPPAPPFATQAVGQRPSVRATIPSAKPSQKREVRPASGEDPPPAVPVTLASLSD